MVLIALVVLIAAIELGARYVLGLGDPPLYALDPQIEYVMKPSATYRRFGNRVAINQWSMRSDDFPRHKADPSELRVMVFGDSITQAGALLDQRELATERLKTDLSAMLRRPVVVGNISAGSWGPVNMLRYAERYGFFDADIVVIVLSSHDVGDVPDFGPRGEDRPTETPRFAIEEGVRRYLPRYVSALQGPEPQPAQGPPPAPSTDAVSTSLNATDTLIRMAGARARVAVALHLERDEPVAAPKPGHDQLKKTATAAGAAIIELGPEFARAAKDGAPLYRDWIHPTAAGQAVIAGALNRWIAAAVTPH